MAQAGSRTEGSDYEFVYELMADHFLKAQQGLRIRSNLHPFLVDTFRMSEGAPAFLCLGVQVFSDIREICFNLHSLFITPGLNWQR